MNEEFEEMFKEFEYNEKPKELILEVNGMTLPDDYLSFMKEHNGGEGPLGKNCYGCFFRMEELQGVNDDYEVSKWWPGHIVIGTDGGGELWAYNPDKGTYCQIDSCNTEDDSGDTYMTISYSLEEFLLKMDEELTE